MERSTVESGVQMGRTAMICAGVALLIVPVNFGVWLYAIDGRGRDAWLVLFSALAFAQFCLGLVAIIQGARSRKVTGSGGVGSTVAGVLATVGAPVGWMLGIAAAALGSMGGAWGRPLRIRGRQLHGALRLGPEWTRGDRPSVDGLDEATRRALEALWLHDAQKEHASVPAFSRVSWMLATVGAPADLLQWCHRAAMEEIEHTRSCFALAAGYGGREHSVRAIEQLADGLGVEGDPFVTLAVESLGDGCQLEDFNADVAAACAAVCAEPVTRRVLQRVAREERSHADFSWAVVQWLLQVAPARVAPALREALVGLEAYRRPTAVSWDKRRLVARADPDALRAHGRLPDARWAELWDERLAATAARLRPLLAAANAQTTAA